MDKNVTLEQLAAYDQAFDADLAKRVAMRAVTSCGVVKAATNNDLPEGPPSVLRFPGAGKITNQSRAVAAGCSLL